MYESSRDVICLNLFYAHFDALKKTESMKMYAQKQLIQFQQIYKSLSDLRRFI